MNKMSYYQQTTELMDTPTASGILSFKMTLMSLKLAQQHKYVGRGREQRGEDP